MLIIESKKLDIENQSVLLENFISYWKDNSLRDYFCRLSTK